MKGGVKIDLDLERYPLQIKTDSTSGSNDWEQIDLYNEQDEWIAFIWWSFRDYPYHIQYCTPDSPSRLLMPSVPSQTDKTWKITKSSTSLTIKCNYVECRCG